MLDLSESYYALVHSSSESRAMKECNTKSSLYIRDRYSGRCQWTHPGNALIEHLMDTPSRINPQKCALSQVDGVNDFVVGNLHTGLCGQIGRLHGK